MGFWRRGELESILDELGDADSVEEIVERVSIRFGVGQREARALVAERRAPAPEPAPAWLPAPGRLTPDRARALRDRLRHHRGPIAPGKLSPLEPTGRSRLSRRR